MSNASPVRVLTACALLNVTVSEEGQAKFRVEETEENGQYMWKLNPELASPVEPSEDGDPISKSRSLVFPVAKTPVTPSSSAQPGVQRPNDRGVGQPAG
jgi:hypothetical protein